MPAGTRRNRPTQSVVAGRRRASQVTSVLGEQALKARRLRGWTQQELAAKIGVDRTRVSQIEAGKGGGVPADLWFALADALGMPFRMEFGRDPSQELEDAGHLEMQEYMLRLGRSVGMSRMFELATRPSNPAYSADVGLRDDLRRLLVLEECWNTFGNIGASVRSTRRKIAEAEALAVAIGGERGAYRVAAVWVVRDAPRNRAVLARYPEIFDATFTASSLAWVKALTTRDVEPPSDMGIVWCDPRSGRLSAWRRSSA
ncbi:MAG: helix-turn-helix transcriptional regulator [Chloroflexota bacterium]|nr:helix-turn-helix transcriptional regulator [Chloroflexota bacterium]